MFLESFKITGSAMAQIFILGSLGYFLVKKNFLGDAGLDALSRLTIDITLPALIFCQLIRDFSFSQYPNWWIFPLVSIVITALGLGIGSICLGSIRGPQRKMQFLSLIAFQNSGYMPLALLAALLPGDKLGTMFIYLFLFLLGFNFVCFSLGVYMLAFTKGKKFRWQSLFSPPVVATLASLALIYLGINKAVPELVYRPLKLIGDCTLVMAMLVVGGNLAQIRLASIDKKAMFLVVLLKLIVMPALGLLLIMKLKLYGLAGLLLIIQLAVPSATNSSVIIRLYKREDLLISQGIFVTHLVSLVTLPLFLLIANWIVSRQ